MIFFKEFCCLLLITTSTTVYCGGDKARAREDFKQQAKETLRAVPGALKYQTNQAVQSAKFWISDKLRIPASKNLVEAAQKSDITKAKKSLTGTTTNADPQYEGNAALKAALANSNNEMLNLILDAYDREGTHLWYDTMPLVLEAADKKMPDIAIRMLNLYLKANQRRIQPLPQDYAEGLAKIIEIAQKNPFTDYFPLLEFYLKNIHKLDADKRAEVIEQARSEIMKTLMADVPKNIYKVYSRVLTEQ